uniref:Uncharacterized protein n=1 Tax=Rhizophora mucronata TaxID=61149 RepID=A0A2P2NZH5_RHIMU
MWRLQWKPPRKHLTGIEARIGPLLLVHFVPSFCALLLLR